MDTHNFKVQNGSGRFTKGGLRRFNAFHEYANPGELNVPVAVKDLSSLIPQTTM
jgi:hypothetical protein